MCVRVCECKSFCPGVVKESVQFRFCRIDLSSSASRVTTWRQPRPRGRSQQAGPGSSWRRHGNRAQRHPGPGLFTLPLWPASSVTLKPIHPGEPGPRPCPHRPALLSAPAGSSSPTPSSPSSSSPPPSLRQPLPKRWEGRAGPTKDSDFQF